MTEAKQVLMLMRQAVANLPDRPQLGVLACAEEIRLVVARYNNADDCGTLALALVGAEVSAEGDA